MRKFSKRILAVLLALLFAFTAFTFAIGAETAEDPASESSEQFREPDLTEADGGGKENDKTWIIVCAGAVVFAVIAAISVYSSRKNK